VQIVIVTAGSRGDVAPFTGLGQRLRQAGHHVTVAAHEPFADLVRGCGLEHRPLPGDPRALIRARTQAPSVEAGRAVTVVFLEQLGEGIAAAVSGADMLLTALGPAPLSRLAAAALGIPAIGTYLAPAIPTGEFALPGSPPPGQPGRRGNVEAGRALLGQADSLYASVLTRLRAKLGLARTSRRGTAGWPVCHGFSPVVVPRPADWPPEVSVTGYWWPAPLAGWHPPADLVAFLRAGPAPVFIGFGSMAPGHGERLGELIAAAVASAGVRAVVQTGWAGLNLSGDDLLAVGDLPHEWLFPRMAAVVHHAGAGTAGAGLRAGVPAVAVPVMADQPFWAERLHRLGIAPRPIPFASLTAESLAGAITAAVTTPGYRHRAAEVARRIAAEDGAAAVLARVRELAD